MNIYKKLSKSQYNVRNLMAMVKHLTSEHNMVLINY